MATVNLKDAETDAKKRIQRSHEIQRTTVAK